MDMSSTYDPQQAFHRGTAVIFSILTPEQTRQLAQVQADPVLIKRIEELAAKAAEDTLSNAERDEYDAYIEANNLLAVLQAEARLHMASHGN